jgi:hypothetical protein
MDFLPPPASFERQLTISDHGFVKRDPEVGLRTLIDEPRAKNF